MTSTDTHEGFRSWGILELFGHRRLGGFISEKEIAGHGFIRIDLYAGDGDAIATQLVSPASVYAIMPTTEEVAREIGKQAPMPVSRWDVQALLPKPDPATSGYEYEPEAGDEGWGGTGGLSPEEIQGEHEDDEAGPDEERF